MSEREELIKRLQEMRERLELLAVEYKVGDQFDGDFQNLDDAISALAAQQSQQEPTEPVAWLHEVTDGDEQSLALSFSPDSFPLDTLTGWKSISHRPLIYGDTAPLSGVRAGYAQKQLNEIVQVMRDNGIETPGWIEHGGVKDTLTVSATLLLWFDALKAGDIQKQADSAIQRITRAADQVNADQPADAVVVPSDEELSALSLDSWERKYHKVRKEISLITWEEVYKRAYVEGFLAAQEGK